MVPALPLLGLGFMVYAAGQGEPEVARSSTPWGIIAALAVPGVLVPWWTLRQQARLPIVPLSRAEPGEVVLRGVAAPLPGAPLRSPNGHDCVWYLHREGRTSSRSSPYHAWDSAQPFLLVDGEHRCVVNPDGAEISGATAPGGGSSEKLIVAGDRLRVVGRLLRSSSELPAEVRRLLERTALPSLPAVCAPGGLSPFLIAVGEEGEGMRRLMVGVNLVLLVGAGLGFAWLRHAGR